MDEAIVRERAADISRTLGNCKKYLHQGNVYSCLTGFKDALERMVVTRMLPQDEKDLQEGVNDFQRQLMASTAFKNTFGPVTFQENENETTLAFVRQLVNVSEEEIARSLAGGEETQENRAIMIMRLKLLNLFRILFIRSELKQNSIVILFNRSYLCKIVDLGCKFCLLNSQSDFFFNKRIFNSCLN